MWEDPIVTEVRRIRQEHAARFGYDLRKIYREIKEQELQSGRNFVSYSPRRVREAVIEGHGDQTTD